jgi:8-oxo-dGTP pyrophosphatase MutT (NUDIX family)
MRSMSEQVLYRLSSAVFAERDGKVLLLKRATGALTGGWYLPGGTVDPGETVEEAARRELMEESALTPSGPLVCVAVAHMYVYGHESLQVSFACPCPDGNVVLSHEHSEAQWIDPASYREQFSDDVIAQFANADPRVTTMLRNIRAAVDSYLQWRVLRDTAAGLASN